MLRAALLIPMMALSAQTSPDLTQLNKMIGRFAPTDLRVDTSRLSSADQKALAKLVDAARIFDDVFLQQLWSGNEDLYAKLKSDQTPLGQARLHYFRINKSPWSDLDGHTAFLPGVPERKPLGANFYPADMTTQEFETWSRNLPQEQRALAVGFFSVIRRGHDEKLTAVPYSEAYHADLQKAAALLREAATLTQNASLKRFLTARADAFQSNDYYASDLAWMDLDAPLDITIGPYETYNDELFGYKAAFEVYVNIRDDEETAKLNFFANHLQEIENNLPIDAGFRNPKLGAQAPIRVVNEVFSGGDGNHGVQTAAYNLPNDERVITQKGSKRVMLKNVQEAKFQKTLIPIAKRVLAADSQGDLNFEAFFTHILAHELSHGIGPHQIHVSGRATNVRQELKDQYSILEEAKADVTGLFMLQYMYDHNLLPRGPRAEQQLYTTFLASSFRSLRFGPKEAHARGMALQMNYLMDKGGFRQTGDGRFAVDYTKIKDAVRSLTGEILHLEATGDYAATKQMLDRLGVIRPSLQKVLDSLADIPVDIEPHFVTADQISRNKAGQ